MGRASPKVLLEQRLGKGGLTSFYDTFVLIQTALLLMNFSAKNPSFAKPQNVGGDANNSRLKKYTLYRPVSGHHCN